MSLKKVHLRKLLQLFYLPDRRLVSELRKDIRQSIKKDLGQKGSGGDFYVPFWADAKDHAAGLQDLSSQTIIRVEDLPGRRRLYPMLEKAFLEWWDNKRRWRNEPFKVINVDRIKGSYKFSEIDATVKVENLFCVQVGDSYNRLVYPYFSEIPSLPDEGFRIGLWLLAEALSGYDASDNRVLDVLRSRSSGLVDFPLQGNERDIFLENYRRVTKQWEELRKEYEY